MTKEEIKQIIQKIHGDEAANDDDIIEWYEKVHEVAFDEFAKQKASEFSQFIYKSEWRQYNDNGWFNGNETDEDLVTTEQLYNQFIESQNK